MKTGKEYSMLETTHVYCKCCGDAPVEFEKLTKDDLNGDKYWGDIVCGKCHLIIASLSKLEE